MAMRGGRWATGSNHRPPHARDGHPREAWR
jgi:hypothetical protein